MTPFTKPLKLGNLLLPHRILYAPLAGCSDFPFRKMSAKYRPALMYCEMVKMDALVRHDEGTFHILDYSTDMHPIGAQLCGSKPALAAPGGQNCRRSGVRCCRSQLRLSCRQSDERWKRVGHAQDAGAHR